MRSEKASHEKIPSKCLFIDIPSTLIHDNYQHASLVVRIQNMPKIIAVNTIQPQQTVDDCAKRSVLIHVGQFSSSTGSRVAAAISECQWKSSRKRVDSEHHRRNVMISSSTINQPRLFNLNTLQGIHTSQVPSQGFMPSGLVARRMMCGLTVGSISS
jgi:hypothetical protein